MSNLRYRVHRFSDRLLRRSLRRHRDTVAMQRLGALSGAYVPRDRRNARYPALPFFRPRMADRCTVLLDDISRRGEQEVVDRWEQELEIKFERCFIDGSTAIAQRGTGSSYLSERP